MKKLLLIPSVFLVALIAGNCDKNDNPPPSNTDYITKSSWKFSNAKAGGIDVSSQIPSCFKDNTILFVANGSGTISESSDVCAPPSAASFTWFFQNNGTQVNLSTTLITGGSGVFDINLMNEVNMVLSQNVTIPPSTTPVNVQITFVH